MKKLSELQGMRIYSDRANYIGLVTDTVVDDKEGNVIGMVFGRKRGKVLTVPYNSILAIGDIVLVHSKKSVEGTAA